MARKLSRNELQESYEASSREASLLRFVLMDMINGTITWQREQKATDDNTYHRYGWGRLDSASGGYLVYSFGAANQPNMVRVEYLDDAVLPRTTSLQCDRFRADAIMAAKSARERAILAASAYPFGVPPMKEVIFGNGTTVYSGPEMSPDPVIAKWSAAKEAYEEDCRRCPNYDDGSPRPSWHAIGRIAQESWYRDPTPRNYKR